MSQLFPVSFSVQWYNAVSRDHIFYKLIQTRPGFEGDSEQIMNFMYSIKRSRFKSFWKLVIGIYAKLAFYINCMTRFNGMDM